MHRLVLCLPLALVAGFDGLEFDRAAAEPEPVQVALADDKAPLPKSDEMEALLKKNPLAILENSLKRYGREVKGYTTTFQKQEMIDGKLYPTEIIEVAFKEEPHSVLFNWKEGARKAERVLYVAGANNDKMLARPAGKAARLIAGDVVTRDVDGSDARASGRYTLKQFGMKLATQRTLSETKAALDAGTTKVDYLGVKKVKEAGDRPAYVIRTSNTKPDREGIMESTSYFDTDTWLQIGSVLKDEKGNTLAAYYWRDIKLNPEFKKDQFEKSALTP